MEDPSRFGPVKFQKIIYAAPGLDYLHTALLQRYALFDKPTPNYETRRIDLADFPDIDAQYQWPFSNSNLPINGIACIPLDNGPFPLALFAHGNHNAAENSTPGYLYLCEVLASHGIIAATIDVNFLNGSIRGENDGRAIVQLEHIRQFKVWNETAGHPLFGKVDLSKVMIVGHSRGGEAVGHASLFNRLQSVPVDNAPNIPVDGSQGLGPFQFALQAVVAIAPTDQQYRPVGGPTVVPDNYYVLHGSRDGDLTYFQGHLTYDRAHRVVLADPVQRAGGCKGLLWIHKANHNYFNSEWGQESANTITRGEQEKIAQIYIGAIAMVHLLGRTDYQKVLMDQGEIYRSGWLSDSIILVSQYQGPERLLIQHSETPALGIELSSPVSGTVSITGVTAQKSALSRPGASSPLLSSLLSALDVNFHLLQDSQGIRIDWTATGGRYTLELDHTSFSVDSFAFFSFRVGQSFEPHNTPSMVQDFMIVFNDGTTSAEIALSLLKSLPYPDEFPTVRPQFPGGGGLLLPPRTDPVTVMQSVFIPLTMLRDRGINPAQLRRVEFQFDRTPSGTLYLDDIQFTK